MQETDICFHDCQAENKKSKANSISKKLKNLDKIKELIRAKTVKQLDRQRKVWYSICKLETLVLLTNNF